MNITKPSSIHVGLAKVDVHFAICQSQNEQEQILSRIREQLKDVRPLAWHVLPHDKWERLTLVLSVLGDQSEILVRDLEKMVALIQLDESCSIVESVMELKEF